ESGPRPPGPLLLLPSRRARTRRGPSKHHHHRRWEKGGLAQRPHPQAHLPPATRWLLGKRYRPLDGIGPGAGDLLLCAGVADAGGEVRSTRKLKKENWKLEIVRNLARDAWAR